MKDVHHLVIAKDWDMNEHIYCIVHLTEILENVIDVLAIHPLASFLLRILSTSL
jgi:hypothetical protein